MRFFLSLSLQDSFGRRKRMLIETSDLGVTLTDQVTAINGVLAKLNAVTDLAVVRADWLVKAIASPVSGAPTSNVDVGATFTGTLEDADGEKASHKLPGIPLAKVQADGTIDLEDADVLAWLAQFIDGQILYLSDGQQMETWLGGVLDK